MSLYKPEEISKLHSRVMKRPDGGWVMITEWDGADDPSAIFFGSDEMMTLTPEETAARDAMVAGLSVREREALTKELSEQADAQIKARTKAAQRGWLIFSAIGWALVALLYAIHPLG